MFPLSWSWIWLILLSAHRDGFSQVHASILITEVSDKGTSNAYACNGEDWIELYNNGNYDIDLGDGYVIFDDQGYQSDDAFPFPTKTTILAGTYRLVCTKGDIDTPQFGIGSDDTLTLIRNNENRSDSYEMIDSVGPLPGINSSFDVTYALDADTNLFSYTSTPTPEYPNIMTPLKSQAELDEARKERLARQYEEGRQFFNMDDHGDPVPDGMPPILHFKVTMSEEDYNYTMENAIYEQYRPFLSAKMLTQNGTELLSLTSPGRIRPKGFSSLYVALCMRSNVIPFQLEMDETNSSQTLFGMQRVILRNHLSDFSFTREWTYFRLLAMFGLPYLRARHVYFYVNGDLIGFYTLLEAPDQEHVFAHNFPNYDPEGFALYKVKLPANDCGDYDHELLEEAKLRLNDKSTPPYSFQRGNHRDHIEELGMMAFDDCLEEFLTKGAFQDVEDDVALAYLRHNQSCPEMLVKEGVIDRDLGVNLDEEMKHFIGEHLSGVRCTPGCTNLDLKNQVNQENFLKSFAFYAVTLSLDSVITWLNNFYLAQTGEPGEKWKIMAYDINLGQHVECGSDTEEGWAFCTSRLPNLSIVRPTCESLESNVIAGPLLTDPALHAQYLEYVKEFYDQVYSNETVFQMAYDHLLEIKEDVYTDFWGLRGVFWLFETSTDPENWNDGIRPSLFALWKARIESVGEQLKAIEEGSVPRGPHIGVLGDVGPLEYCVDWRSEKQNTTNCVDACLYEGCHVEGWIIESYCDEAVGICYHGYEDPLCAGISKGDQYEGMKDTPDGRPTHCWFAKGIPVHAAECPEVGASSGSTGTLHQNFSLIIVLIGVVAALYGR